MKLLLLREYDNGNDTVGKLFYRDGARLCYVYTLEDEYRADKVSGETRIPAGEYKIVIRRYGKFYDSYVKSSDQVIQAFTQKYGVMEITNVPNFTNVLIHLGNADTDTMGCLLTGDQCNNNSYKSGYITDSAVAYKRLIRAIEKCLDKAEDLIIIIKDFDKEIEKMI